MKWSSAGSLRHQPGMALSELLDQNPVGAPDLVMLYSTHHHATAWSGILARLKEVFPKACIVGCAGHSVIGGGTEIEEAPGMALVTASLPDVEVQGWHLPAEAPDSAWQVGAQAEQEPALILLSDPTTVAPEAMVRQADRIWPGCPKVGGLVSGGSRAGENALFLGDRVLRGGTLAITLWGDLLLHTVVAQGCRPLTEAMTITRCEGNQLFELDGRPAVETLEALFARLGETERDVYRRAPLIGLAETEGRRDWLVRNLIGLDRRQGVVRVGATLKNGQKASFQLRDRRTAHDDLEELLGRLKRDLRGLRPEAALLFSCLGRGRAFYEEPDHDSRLIAEYLGGLKTAGIFCNGELGPVHGRTWLHGYTSAVGVFTGRGWS